MNDDVFTDVKNYLQAQINSGIKTLVVSDDLKRSFEEIFSGKTSESKNKATHQLGTKELFKSNNKPGQPSRIFEKSHSDPSAPTEPVLTCSVDLTEILPDSIIQKNLTKTELLEHIRSVIGDCTRCPLCEHRKSIVFGEGNPDTKVMFIGEGPGAEEDLKGRPFVGKAGQLLDKMVQAMKFERESVYIANIVKCRPPRNRDPQTIEIQTCIPFLEAQIQIINPSVIIALGRIAAQTLLKTKDPISYIRGKFVKRNNIEIMPTYHPSYLLRAQDLQPKREAWMDLKEVMHYLNIPV